MRKSLASSLIVCLITYSAVAQTNWKIDPVHSSIQFDVTHLVVSTVTGSFTEFSGNLTSSGETFENSKVECSVNVNSIDTENLTRDKHLKEDDFFNAQKSPSISFKSTSFKKTGDNQYKIEGDLTIRDVTKTVSFMATNSGTVNTGKKTISGFKVTGQINRFDFNLKWDDTLDSGSLVVGENVDIRMNLELVKI